jgi:alcohol dehydrogenase class IV
MTFEFATAGRIVFGAGTLAQAPALLASFGRRALIVTGRNPERSGSLARRCADSGLDVRLFSIANEPTVADIERGVAFARETQRDVVAAIGGGSAIDGGKAIAAIATSSGPIADYLEVIGRALPLTAAPLPFVAVPTTAGTGSEVTRNAVLASPTHRVKVSLRSPAMLPRVALIDPELTYDLPPALTASTGMDALAQLLEPFVCTRATLMTDALCADGLARVGRALRTAFAHGNDAGARSEMAYASLLGGIALANAGLGAVHGFAGPLGGAYSAPHGALCAALLPAVVEVNVRALRERHPESAALERYRRAATLLTGDPHAEADALVGWFRTLVADLAIPGLAAGGVTPAEFGAITAAAQKASSMKPNPVVLTERECHEILAAAL